MRPRPPRRYPLDVAVLSRVRRRTVRHLLRQLWVRHSTALVGCGVHVFRTRRALARGRRGGGDDEPAWVHGADSPDDGVFPPVPTEENFVVAIFSPPPSVCSTDGEELSDRQWTPTLLALTRGINCSDAGGNRQTLRIPARFDTTHCIVSMLKSKQGKRRSAYMYCAPEKKSRNSPALLNFTKYVKTKVGL